jgi:hypothetical protein
VDVLDVLVQVPRRADEERQRVFSPLLLHGVTGVRFVLAGRWNVRGLPRRGQKT